VPATSVAERFNTAMSLPPLWLHSADASKGEPAGTRRTRFASFAVCVPVSPEMVIVAGAAGAGGEYRLTFVTSDRVMLFCMLGHGVDCTISLPINAGAYTLSTCASPVCVRDKEIESERAKKREIE